MMGLAISKKKPALFFFLLAILFAFLASSIAVSTVNSFNAQTTAIVPTKVIPPYTKITQDMLTQATVPASSILRNKIKVKDISEIVGKYSNTTLNPGMPVVQDYVINAPGGEVTAELNSQKRNDIRALPIPVTEITGFGGKLDKGDQIDFIATLQNTSSQGPQMITTYIAQSVPIISKVSDGGKLTGIIVEVTAQQAQDLSHYLETGKIKMVVKPQPSGETHLEPTQTNGFQTMTTNAGQGNPAQGK